MSEIRHLCCDRCGDTIVIDHRRAPNEAEQGWANCRINLEHYDFCPNCWRIMFDKKDSV
jgi:Fe2+ or Zn2+ uptake regulation protein